MCLSLLPVVFMQHHKEVHLLRYVYFDGSNIISFNANVKSGEKYFYSIRELFPCIAVSQILIAQSSSTRCVSFPPVARLHLRECRVQPRQRPCASHREHRCLDTVEQGYYMFHKTFSLRSTYSTTSIFAEVTANPRYPKGRAPCVAIIVNVALEFLKEGRQQYGLKSGVVPRP